MVLIVTAENRHLFEAEICEMYRQRGRMFVERLGWPLPLREGLERDSYDEEDVVYLLVKDRCDGELKASVRLLPTDRPHPLLDLFPHLCDGAVPCGPDVWEISRFCPNPALGGRRERLALLWEIICGSLETALLFGIERLTFVANRRLRPLALGCGWDAVPLGATRADDHDDVTAVMVSVEREGLRRVRERFGIDGPVVRFYPCVQAAA